MKNNSRNLAIEDHFLSYYQLDVYDQSAVGTVLKQLIDNLPTTPDEQPYMYANVFCSLCCRHTHYTPTHHHKHSVFPFRFLDSSFPIPSFLFIARTLSHSRDFINTYGTHYIVSAQFGGKVNFTVAYDKSITSKYGEAWTADQISATLKWQKLSVGFKMNNNQSTAKIDGEFKSHSWNNTETDGGMPVVFALQGYEAWVDTIIKNPGMSSTTSLLLSLCFILLGAYPLLPFLFFSQPSSSTL